MWSVQGNLEDIPYHAGATYTYECTLKADKDKRVYVKVADGNEEQLAGGIVDLRAGVPVYYSIEVPIPKDFDSTVSLKFGWGKMEGDSIEDNGSVNVQVKDVSFRTTTWIPDPDYTTTPGPTTTPAPTTTEVPTTTEIPTETEVPTATVVPTTSIVPTVTAVPTTKITPVTTKQKTTTKKTTKNKLSKGKIKKVSRKKKSLKLKLKKIKGATGYHIRYSDNKKFDGYWDKYTKKTTVKIKKLDRKTKYYLKVRGYKKVGAIKTFGKFSKRKKVKTK